MTEQQQETFNLHGKYQAQSGKRYQYYGHCKTWVPGGQSPWRIYLYDENKKFIHDDVRTISDMLAQFDSFGLKMEMGRELTMSLARSATEERIEARDQANAKS
jgi:hypothetical protein